MRDFLLSLTLHGLLSRIRAGAQFLRTITQRYIHDVTDILREYLVAHQENYGT
jgi:hypothetical protein